MSMFDTEASRAEAVTLMCNLLRLFYAAGFDIDQFHDVIDDAHEKVADEV